MRYNKKIFAEILGVYIEESQPGVIYKYIEYPMPKVESKWWKRGTHRNKYSRLVGITIYP